MQTSWNDLPGGPKDVVEWWTLATLSAKRRESERFAWEIGVRFEALARAERTGDPAYTFAARPWEAYVDVAPAKRLRFKVGNQIVAWGRLDVGSAADVLGVYDLRQGPVLDVDALRIPTPTATATWFPVDAFQLDLAYTPFFTPHLFDVTGTNYALIGPDAPGAVTQLFSRLRQQLDPSSAARITSDLASANAPSARPDNGEAAARATWRAGPYDLGVTYGYVRSKLPAIVLSPSLVRFLASPDLTSVSQVNQALNDGEHLATARYDRYHQLAIDLEGTAGPFTIAGEAGWSPSRTLLVRDETSGLPAPASSSVAQTGVKISYAKDETFSWTAEGSVFAAGDAPPDVNGLTQNYYVLGARRRLFVAFTAAHKSFGKHELDGAFIATSSGPSLSYVGRYGYRVSEPLLLGAGAALFGGPRGDDGSLATLQRGLDQVFLFLSFRP